MNIIYFKDADLEGISDYLKVHRITNYKINSIFRQIYAEILLKNIMDLGKQPWLRWLEEAPEPPQLLNLESRTMGKVNILSQKFDGGRNLTGKGIKAGVWDGDVEHHIDLGNRLINKENEYYLDHGMHVTGIMAGAGVIDPAAKGMAPETMVYSWNNTGDISEKIYLTAVNDGIVITQNSYGEIFSCGNTSDTYLYNTDYASVDMLNNEYFPYLTQCYAAGNYQRMCLSNTNGKSTNRSKNTILVGNVDASGNISPASSCGPMNDGRIIPTICALGQNIYSTVYNNSYAYLGGTSMACPMVSGIVALLYERYKQLNNDQLPLASLIKAVVCNTAADKGNIGPDNSYGYGIINSLRAVRLLENKQYITAKITNNAVFTQTINIPQNAKEVKIMIVWSDKAGNPGTVKALVNDLDLKVTQNGTDYYPWILDENNPWKPATKGVDTINNIEQVNILNPAGSYTVSVTGSLIPEGEQEFSLVYDYILPALELTYPNGNETFTPGSKEVIRWESDCYDDNITLEYSANDGSSYSVIASGISKDINNYIWTVPADITKNARIRVSQNGIMDVNDLPFNIMTVPSGLNLKDVPCSKSAWSMNWNKIPGAKFEVLKADVNNGDFDVIGTTKVNDTTFALPDLTNDRNNWYSVRAIDSATGAVSQRAYAIQATPDIAVSASDLPFSENFDNFTSNTLKLTANSASGYKYYTINLNNPELIMFGTDSIHWNVAADLFAANPNNITTAKICEIDASSINADLWLSFDLSMAYSSAPSNSAFRVLINGNPVTDINGKTVFSSLSDNNSKHLYFNLDNYVKTKFSVEFQSVTKSMEFFTGIDNIRIYQAADTDLAMTELSPPSANINLSLQSDVTIKVINLSSNPVSNVRVSYNVNDSAVVKEIITKTIAPHEVLSYTFTNKADLSAEAKYIINASINYAGDLNPDNNNLTYHTENTGNYYVMPAGVNNSKVISQTIKFIDDGIFKYYSPYFTGATTFIPQPGKAVKIKFYEFTLDNNDYIKIYNGEIANEANLLAKLTGTSLPAEYTSTSVTVNALLPSLTTDLVTMITDSSALSGGKITSSGGNPVIMRGLCWNTAANPTVDDYFLEDLSVSDTFSGLISGLKKQTKYFVRAYAVNSSGISYGNEQQFVALGINNIQQEAAFYIYPNPTNGIVILKFNYPIHSNLNINIYNSLGQLMFLQNITDNIVKFDLSYFTKGLYIVEIQSDFGLIRKKLIVN